MTCSHFCDLPIEVYVELYVMYLNQEALAFIVFTESGNESNKTSFKGSPCPKWCAACHRFIETDAQRLHIEALLV